jgi:hypothetical protein
MLWDAHDMLRFELLGVVAVFSVALRFVGGWLVRKGAALERGRKHGPR